MQQLLLSLSDRSEVHRGLQNGGKMSPHEITKKLLMTTDKIDGQGVSPWYGKGRVNAYRAVTE